MRMGKWISILTTVVFLVLLFLGCKTELMQPEIKIKSYQNPYDWVGEEHNKCLDHVVSKVAEDSLRDWQTDDVKALVIGYFASSGNQDMPTSAQPIEERLNSIVQLSQKGVDAYLQYVDSLVGEGTVSILFRDFNLDIFKAIEHDNVGSLLEDTARRIEQANISQHEKDILLMEISIARHSTQFWKKMRPKAGKRPILGLGPIPILVGVDVIGGGMAAYFSWRSGNTGWDIAMDALVGAAGTSACAWLGARIPKPW